MADLLGPTLWTLDAIVWALILRMKLGDLAQAYRERKAVARRARLAAYRK